MTRKRSNLIDAVKGIGIILVVFAHVYYGHDALVLIYSFHMPLFFIVSGMLFQKDRHPEFLPFLKKRVKRLLVPYAIYECVSIFVLYAAERAYDGMFDVSQTEYKEYFRQILLSNWSGTHVNQPLWFLPCLFLVEIIYYFTAKLNKSAGIAICVILACFGWVLEAGIFDFDNMILPWSLDSALFALGFYAFGNLCSEELQAMAEKIRKSSFKVPVCMAAAVGLATIWFPLSLINEKVTLGTKILNNGFLLYATGILGTLMILFLCILLENNRFLTYCGRHSFEIMAVHYIIRKYLVRPLYVVWNGKAYNRRYISEAWLPFLVIFALSILYTVLYSQIRSGIAARLARHHALHP